MTYGKESRPASVPEWPLSGSRLLGAMVALTMVRSEAEAEVLCGMLRANGIACGYQQTNVGAGAADGLPRGGALEIFVAGGDLRQARKLLGTEQDGR
jgi:hypothetical protein